MPGALSKAVRAAKSDVSSSVSSSSSSDPELDQLGGDPRNVIQPSQARHQNGRKRFVDSAACERDYAAAEREFIQAMQEYKQRSGRMFPTWSEVLEVLCSLGYEKTTGDGEVRSVRTAPTGMGPGPYVKPAQFGGGN